MHTSDDHHPSYSASVARVKRGSPGQSALEKPHAIRRLSAGSVTIMVSVCARSPTPDLSRWSATRSRSRTFHFNEPCVYCGTPLRHPSMAGDRSSRPRHLKDAVGRATKVPCVARIAVDGLLWRTWDAPATATRQ